MTIITTVSTQSKVKHVGAKFLLLLIKSCARFRHLRSGSHLRVENSSESGGRRDTGASLDSVGASSGSLSPLEPPSPLFPRDGSGGEGSLTSEVFLNVLKLNQNRKRQEARYGTHLLVLDDANHHGCRQIWRHLLFSKC